MKCQYHSDVFQNIPENIIICSDDIKWNTILNSNNKGIIISISCINNDSSLTSDTIAGS